MNRAFRFNFTCLGGHGTLTGQIRGLRNGVPVRSDLLWPLTDAYTWSESHGWLKTARRWYQRLTVLIGAERPRSCSCADRSLMRSPRPAGAWPRPAPRGCSAAVAASRCLSRASLSDRLRSRQRPMPPACRIESINVARRSISADVSSGNSSKSLNSAHQHESIYTSAPKTGTKKLPAAQVRIKAKKQEVWTWLLIMIFFSSANNRSQLSKGKT